MKKSGRVYLVGAGPGDAGLLTRRGAELLARADVVIATDTSLEETRGQVRRVVACLRAGEAR